MKSFVFCMLLSSSFVALYGFFAPLNAIPILLWEFLWKTFWMVAVIYPKWQDQSLSGGYLANAFNCGLGVVLTPLVVPWDYVWQTLFPAKKDKTPAIDA